MHTPKWFLKIISQTDSERTADSVLPDKESLVRIEMNLQTSSLKNGRESKASKI